MLRSTILALCLAGVTLAGCTTTLAAPGPPPPPRRERVVVAPRADLVRVPGHWRWNGRRWVWVSGHWVVRR